MFEQEWEDFKNSVIPADAHETQIVEMRLAFYAGAFLVCELSKKSNMAAEIIGFECKDFFLTTYGKLIYESEKK